MALSPSASYKSHYQQFTPPFEIPKSWQWVNITEVTSKITDGTHHSPENKPIGDFLYITAKNIKYDGIKKDSATYVNSNVHTEIYSRCNPEYGDILYIKDGATAGVVAINDLKVPFSLLSSVALIKPLGILNRYLYYFLRSDFSNSSIKKSMKGVGITRITLRQIEEWNIPVPPYAEQERIVKILDNYFSILSYLEWNIDTLQESIHNAKSKILDLAMQGKLVPQDPADEPAADIILRINPKAKIITDNPHYPQLPDNWAYLILSDINSYKSSTVTPANMPGQLFDLYSVPIFSTMLPEKTHGSEIGSAKQVVKKGDVLLCKINPHLNRVWEITKDSNNIQIASSEWIVVRSEFHHPPFLKWYFNSPKFRTLLSSQVSGVGGSLTRAQPAIVKSYLVPIPPMEEQKRISSAIELWFKSLDSINLSLTN